MHIYIKLRFNEFISTYSQVNLHIIEASSFLPRAVYSSDRNVKTAEQEILKKQVLKSQLKQDDGGIKVFASVQNCHVSAERCLENGEKSPTNHSIEIGVAVSPLIANETPEEIVDAEGKRTMSGEVKTDVLDFLCYLNASVGLLTISNKILPLFH